MFDFLSERVCPVRRSIAVFAFIVLGSIASPAKASPIVFDVVNGLFADGATLTGTITIDPTNAIGVTAIDMVVSGHASEPIISTQSFFTGGGVFGIGAASADHNMNLVLELPVVNLLGYSGGQLLTQLPAISTYHDNATGGQNIDLVSGELDPQTVPEPASITLLATAFLAAGGFHLARRR